MRLARPWALAFITAVFAAPWASVVARGNDFIVFDNDCAILPPKTRAAL